MAKKHAMPRLEYRRNKIADIDRILDSMEYRRMAKERAAEKFMRRRGSDPSSDDEPYEPMS